MKTIRRKLSVLLLASLFAALCLTGCGTAGPDSITISAEGEEVTRLEVLYGSELPELTAVISPDSYSGEISWSSDDAGVVKVESADGTTCQLKVLKTGTCKITAACGDLSASVKITIDKNQDQLSARDTAVTVNGVKYSVEKLNLYFADQYNTFVSNYGSSASSYGLDLSTGFSGLDKQSCDYSDDGTWRGYFLDAALSMVTGTQALCDYADANGIVLDDTDTAEIEDTITSLEETAESQGYASADDYLSDRYGSGMTVDIYRDHLTTKALASKAYHAYAETLTYSDAEITSHYAEMGYEGTDNNYPLTSMRHILIMAEADADGNYTEEAIAAAHEKAEEIYAEWQAGDATEDSFAALANEYSADTGSNTTGGLYENIYKGKMVDGINTWLFAAGRQAGDTAVIDNDGSYVGTHIVYFVGKGENYSTWLSVSDLKETDVSNWLEELTADYTAETGDAYSQAGLF